MRFPLLCTNTDVLLKLLDLKMCCITYCNYCSPYHLQPRKEARAKVLIGKLVYLDLKKPSQDLHVSIHTVYQTKQETSFDDLRKPWSLDKSVTLVLYPLFSNGYF